MKLKYGFKKGNFGKIGIEEEFQIIDSYTKDLAPYALKLLENLKSNNYSDEIFLSMIELKTDVCTTVQEAENQLIDLRKKLKETANTYGLDIVGAGTHPFADWRKQKMNPKPRYIKQMKENNGLNQLEVTYGLHIHLGVDDADQAIKVFNMVRKIIPHLIAISANSPFWESKSNYMSSRMFILDSVPQYGFPKKFLNWEDYYQTLLELSKKFKSIRSSGDVFWDLRIRPELGTVEIRCLDSQNDVRMSASIAALLVAYVNYGIEYEVKEEKIHKIRLAAITHGINDARRNGIRNETIALLNLVKDVSKKMNIDSYIDYLESRIKEKSTPAEIQLKEFLKNKDFKSVVEVLKI